MLHNETWLVHSELLNKWAWHREDWVRNLGWADEMYHTLLNDYGWHVFGNANLTIKDYIDIVTAEHAEERMYCFKNGRWDYVDGPALFVYRKNEQEAFIAGYTGRYETVKPLEGTDPWEWENITVIDVDPEIAVIKRKKQPEGLPVIFMSNGEREADVNWATLKNAVPRAVRLDGISGRRRAFIESAKLAGDASHFFIVTGKNSITKPEVFEYRPNIQQVGSKHTVFFAKNMSNDLISGHMAIGCYNTATVLNTPVDFGLDFTEAGGIVTVPILASEANFATTPYEAWRTAFRESVKLSLQNTPVATAALTRWTTYAIGPNAEWVIQGAMDGVNYATTNQNNPEALRKTVEWDWLREYWDTTSRLKVV